MDTCLHCPKTPPGSPKSLSPPKSSDSEVSEGVRERERERIFGQLSKAVRVVFLTEGKKETSANTYAYCLTASSFTGLILNRTMWLREAAVLLLRPGRRAGGIGDGSRSEYQKKYFSQPPTFLTCGAGKKRCLRVGPDWPCCAERAQTGTTCCPPPPRRPSLSPPTREKALRRLRWSRPEPSLDDDVDVDVGRRFRESLQDGDIHSLAWRRRAVVN